MKILLTNDDGWDAPGLKLLQTLAQDFGEIWSVAPTHPMSGISHQVTLERPLQLMKMGEREYSLDGTPADCVRIGMTQLDMEFDWVLSGINNGANLGSDVYVSGTVAAAREAALRGARSMALSQHRRKFKDEFEWAETESMAHTVLENYLLQRQFDPGTMININFPDRFHPPEGPDSCSINGVASSRLSNELSLVECEIDRHPLPTDFHIDEEGRFFYCSKYNDRLRMPGCDLEICFSGQVSVSFLKMV